MADNGRFASTVCFFLILTLGKVSGIRTGDHIATSRKLLDLLNDHGLTAFLDLVKKAEIQNSFNSQDELTVFAFTNKAFDILPSERKTAIRQKNRRETEDFVKFHTVFKQRILTEQILDNHQLRSNGPNQNILFTNKKRVQIGIDYDRTEQIFINGARIVKRDIYASNGILQIIDRVLEITSNKMAVPYLDHPDDPRVKGKQFYDLIQHSLVHDELKNEGRMTLFVPTDEAMSQIDKEKLDQQRQDQQGLREILLKHRVSGQVIFTSTIEFGTQWIPNSNIPILNKNTYDQVSVTSGDTTALIVLGNITVGNGVIHMIDNFLGFTYKTVIEQIMQDPQLTEFYSLLNKVHIQKIQEAISTRDKVTIFAPTNEAFRRIKNNRLQHDTKFIEEIIKYHIIEDNSWSIAPITFDYNARERQMCMLGSFLTVYNFRYDRFVEGGYVAAKIIRVDVGCTNGIVQYIDRILGIPDENIMSVIYNHPWLKKLPYMAYSVVGLKDSLAGEQVINDKNSVNLCPGRNCFYTVFVPNGTAFEQMRLLPQSEGLLRETATHRYLLERLIFRNIKIYEQDLAVGDLGLTAVNGNKVYVEKNHYGISLRYRGKISRVIHSDLGATNGVVHIIDQMLWTTDDSYLTTSSSHRTRFIDLISVVIILISLSVLLH